MPERSQYFRKFRPNTLVSICNPSRVGNSQFSHSPGLTLKNFFRAIFFQNGFSTLTEKTVAQNYIAVIIIGIIASLPIASIIKQFAQNISASKSGKAVVNLSIVLFVLFSLTVSTASLIGDSYNPFLYFRF